VRSFLRITPGFIRGKEQTGFTPQEFPCMEEGGGVSKESIIFFISGGVFEVGADCFF
jgi:hypothetical protein